MTVTASAVSNAQNQTMTGGDQNFTFTRLFGDSDGNGLVNASDFALFGQAFNSVANSSNSYFDYNGDTFINASDFAAFGQRFGTSISPPSYPGVSLPSVVVATNTQTT